MPRRALLAGLGVLAIAGVLAFALAYCRERPARPPTPIDPPPSHATDPRDPPELVRDPGTRTPVEPADPGLPSDPQVIPAAGPEDGEGWRATGTVRMRSRAPLAGARVELSWVDGAEREHPLGSTESDGDGRYELALTALDGLSPGALVGAQLVVRGRASKHEPAEARRSLEWALSERLAQVDLTLDAGSVLTFTAVDRRGEPVPQAEAKLAALDADGAPVPGAPVVARADGEGRIALGFVSATRYRLSVRANGAGLVVRTLAIESADDLDLGRIVLEGGEPIAGVVRHPDGTPAPGVELWALEGDLAFSPYGLGSAESQALKREREGGLSLSRGFTDAEGRFALGGLRPGHFAIRAREVEAMLEPRQGRWEPGQAGIELELGSARLVVRVVDEHGAPVPGAIVEATAIVLDIAGDAEPGHVRRAIARGASAIASFDADPETPLAVRARTQHLRSTEEIAFLGQGGQHAEVELRLLGSAERGSLRFALVGVTPPGLVTWRVALLAPRSRLIDAEVGELAAGENGVVRDVPAGEHALEIGFAGEGGSWLLPWRSRATVRIEPGVETPVSVDAEIGARLAVRAELIGPPPAGLAEAGDGARARFGARFTLVAADGEPRSLALQIDGKDVDALLPGERADVVGLVPAGDWTLQVEGPAWLPGTHALRTIAGRRVEAYAELRAVR